MANAELESTLTLTFNNGIKVAVTYPFWMRVIALHSVPGLTEVISAAVKIDLDGKDIPVTKV